MQGSVGINNNSVDAGLRLDQSHATRKPHHEDALREGFAGQSISGEDRHAVQRTAATSPSWGRSDGGGARRRARNSARSRPMWRSRCPAAAAPPPPAWRSRGSRMAIDHGRPRRSPITWLSPPAATIAWATPMRLRIAMLLSTTWPLAKPPRSMRTPCARKAHRAGLGVEDQVLPAHDLACALQRGRVGRDALPVVVQMPDAGIGDVEGAVGDARELERALDQAEHLGADRHAGVGRFAVDARQFRIGLEGAHQAVDAMHLRHHRVDRALGQRRHRRATAPRGSRCP